MSAQKTIRREISAEGIGLHSGHSIQIGLSPAGPDTGIIFRGEDGTLIAANTAHVVDGSYATTLGAYGIKIRTVEHLMAAASALGVDNLIVDVRGDELPAMDGSARPFVDLLLEAGITSLPAPRRPIVVEQPIRVEQGTRFLQVLPADGLRISYTLDHDHPAIGLQVMSLSITAEAFVEAIAPARTYGFLKDVGIMRRHGLARGGSLDNAVVVGRRGVINEHLRFPDEFVRHKILDLVGDLCLLGRPLMGHVVARNAGHALNHELVAAIEKAWAPGRPSSRRRGTAREAAGRDGQPILPDVAAV
jgi:UDP-3-O-[3-hydroxymyristoyl] N-acetylglucosamine deacetylase